MARARTIRSMLDRKDDKRLKAFWVLKNITHGQDRKLVRQYITDRIKELRGGESI